MGASDSKSADSKYELTFSEGEKKIAVGIHHGISHGKKTFNKENFQHFTSPVLDQVISGRLFDLLDGPLPQKQHQNKVPHTRSIQSQTHEIHLNHFTAHLVILLKGGVLDLAHTCISLASPTEKTVAKHELIKLVDSFLHSYEKLLSAHCTAYQSWIFAAASDSHDRMARSLLNPLIKSEREPRKSLTGSDVNGKQPFTVEQVSGWLSQCSIFMLILDQVFRAAFQFYDTEPPQMTFKPQIPHVRDTNWSKFKTILNFPSVLFLNFSLLNELQTEWKLVFSSGLHGSSFSQLLQCLRNKGPTYLVVRDKGGYVFGGFASVSWDINSKFVGNSSCFLFSVNPNFCTYIPTGYNDNFMYLNHQVQTLPNGLGMGGQFEFFGLWIDQSFDHGHSKASAKGCTTYGSPQLSSKEEFHVECIEVWAVGKKAKQGDEDDEDEDEPSSSTKAGKKSILDKLDGADKAILDMVDKGTVSDAIREVPFVDETEAHRTIISPF